MRSFEVTATPTLYHTLQLALIRAKQPLLALEILDTMTAHGGVAPNPHNYTAALMACSRAGATAPGMADRALLLLQDLAAMGVKPHDPAKVFAMEACHRDGKPEAALDILSAHLGAGLPITPQLAGAGLEACALLGRVKPALALLDVLELQKLTPRPYFYGAVLRACGKASDWQTAANLLLKLREGGQVPLKRVYREAIAVLARTDQWRIAGALLRDMLQHAAAAEQGSSAVASGSGNAPPSAFLWNIVAGATARASRWEETLELMREGDALGAAFDLRSCATAMHACLVNERWEEVVTLAESFPARGLALETATAGMALKACHHLNDDARGASLQEAISALGVTPATDAQLEEWFQGIVEAKGEEAEGGGDAKGSVQRAVSLEVDDVQVEVGEGGSAQRAKSLDVDDGQVEVGEGGSAQVEVTADVDEGDEGQEGSSRAG
ncbi:hypothetical protein JKP88DRAFT_216350 [Tribonema minus]|uniref:Pentatricopeptide repeat-containing protein n=1 Tax=Tribonema minus TaxID=303371 RepID=A0A836C8X8_9STRA|nr:hypothetical protein JKP88DRAFT_216350 [Tribonema minus]